MGKKNRTSNKQKQESLVDQKPSELSKETSMEDHERSEKQFQNLRGLYATLLKKTMDDKQQIESLVKGKDMLEAELARTGSENTRLVEELANKERTIRLSKKKQGSAKYTVEINEMMRINKYLRSDNNGLHDKVTKLENYLDMEKAKSREDHKSMKESKAKGLVVENNTIKHEAEFDKLSEVVDGKNKALLDHVSGLEKNVDESIENTKAREYELEGLLVENNMEIVELEKTIEPIGEELEEVKSELMKLIKEKKELENQSDSLREENGILQKDNVELKKAMFVLKTELVSAHTIAKPGLIMLKEIDELKRENKELKSEKMEREIIKCNQKETILELEKKLKYLDEIVKSLTKQNKILNDLDVVVEKEKAREEQTNALAKEKSVKESEFESLLDENISIKRHMEVALVQLSNKEKLVDELLSENLIQAKDTLEAELAHSSTENNQLRDELWVSDNENIMLKLETIVFKEFFDRKAKEMGFEVDELVKEKSDREYEIRDLKREVDDPKGKLESERKETSLREEAGPMRYVNDIEVKDEKEREIKEPMSKKIKEKEEFLKSIEKERTNSEKTLKVELKREIKEPMSKKMKEKTNAGKTLEPKREIKGLRSDKTKKKELPKKPVWR